MSDYPNRQCKAMSYPADKVAGTYERRHGEIFNPIEQQRLRKALEQAIAAVKTSSQPITALDYGCGSGNLTRHLIELGVSTVSADVCQEFLSGIKQRFGPTGLARVLKVNGTDLSGLADNQFDMVVTYSVLHHVQDYLHIVKQMCRIVKPGGVIYIDHDVNESYYTRPQQYVEFLRKVQPRVSLRRLLRVLLDVRGYGHVLSRIRNPRYSREGDIHVWPDDHIEWDKIEQVVRSQGFEVVLKQDYLLYKSHYDREIYNQYKDKCTDERLLIARKK